MNVRMPPHDIAAEEAALGSMLLSRQALIVACDSGVTAGDFFKPAHQHIFEAMRTLHRDGEPVDVVTVTDCMRATGVLDQSGGQTALLELQAFTPAFSAVASYLKVVSDTARRRRLISAASEIAEIGYTDHDPDVSAERAKRILGAASESAASEMLEDFYWSMDVPLDQLGDRDESQPWVHHGVVRVGQRLGILAPAGVGKSMLLTQLAMCAENGVHCFTGATGNPPMRAMHVELEGSKHDIQFRFNLERAAMVKLGIGSANQLHPGLLHRQGGINLSTEAGYVTLRRALKLMESGGGGRNAGPVGLVTIGPQKYFGTPGDHENYEQFALKVQTHLNMVIAEFGCALVIEVHASKDDNVAGSKRWQDWPDIGWALRASDDAPQHLDPTAAMRFDVERYRQPRDTSTVAIRTLWRNASNSKLPWISQNDRLHDGRMMNDLLNGPNVSGHNERGQ
jgi:DnaB-like helicase N terminal domain/AAA domain